MNVQSPSVLLLEVTIILMVSGIMAFSQPCPLINSSTITPEITVGGTINFMATGSGGSGNCTLSLLIREDIPNAPSQLIGSVSGGPNLNLSSSSILDPGAFPAGNYIARFIYSCDGPGCVPDIDELPLNISDEPRIISTDLPTAICEGGKVDFRVEAIGGIGGCILKLEIRSTAPNSPFMFIASVSGGPNKILSGSTTLPALQFPAGSYELRASYDCDMDGSAEVEVISDLEIANMPSILESSITSEVCEGGRLDFEAIAGCGIGNCSLALYIRRKEPGLPFNFLASVSGTPELKLLGSTTLNIANYPAGTYEIRLTYSSENDPFPPIHQFSDIVVHPRKPELVPIAPLTLLPNDQCQGILPDFRDSTMVIDFCDANPMLLQIPGPGTILQNLGGSTTVSIIATNAYGLSDTISFPVVLEATIQGYQLNCRNISTSPDQNGLIDFRLDEIVPGANCIVEHELTLESESGQIIAHLQNLIASSEISFSACDLTGSEVKAIVRNRDGQTCWSRIRIDEATQVQLESCRKMSLWCFSKAVGDISAYEETYGKPLALRPCLGVQPSIFVADWINTDFECTNDTLKVIFREYEAFDKNGHRANTFDTLIIFRSPRIDISNTFCSDSDTLQCGVNDHPVSRDPLHPLYDIIT